MIRGAEQGFKFTTSFDFDDIDTIVAVFSQPNNNGTAEAPMPIQKYYNRAVTMVDVWNESGKNQTTTYGVGTKYYRYDATSSDFVASNIQPTESDVFGGTVDAWPLSDTYDISKVYKCDQSYYQYNPNTQKWGITTEEPSVGFVSMSAPGVANIPSDANKQMIYTYDQRYYRHNGAEWVESTDCILPIEEVEYWDHKSENQYDADNIYCAEETYYKYIDGEWRAYGPSCMQYTEVAAWNSDESDSYDKAKIYMFKELYYQYNASTDQFEKTGVREVYYRYDANDGQWEECEAPDAHLEEIDLWLLTEESEKNVKNTYVCKCIYYRYNTETDKWEASNNMLIPVVEISEWKTDGSVYYDNNKIYTRSASYYQYSIADDEWKEVSECIRPTIANLDYWTDPMDLDKNVIYLCGPTYFQYDSVNEKWTPSDVCDIEPIKIDYPSQATDHSKIYVCGPLYYKYDDGAWNAYKCVADAVRNDGFTPVDGDTKSFVSMLSAEETLRFNERYKGRVQVTVYSSTVNRTDKSTIEYFTVYPTMTNDTFSQIPSGGNVPMVILDAGEIISE